MKPFLHPFKQTTTIQRKDGSTLRRTWAYLRSNILRLEGESKAWRQLNARIKNKPIQSLSPVQALSFGSDFRRRRERGVGRFGISRSN